MKNEDQAGQRLEASCNIIYDLLPLYIDEICSEESRVLVEEHLNGCAQCRGKFEAMTGKLILELSADHDGKAHNTSSQLKDRSAVKVLKKIKRRWLITLLATVLLIPLLLLSVNQYRGEGVSFNNLYDYYSAGRYVAALEQGDYEKAFTYVDVASYYEITQRDIINAQSSTIDREEYQLVIYADGRQEYTNGEITIPAEEFEQWLIDAKQGQVELREWYEQSPYKEMSYEQFYEFSKQNYIRHLTEWKKLGYILKGRGMADAYKNDRDTNYNYNYSVRISQENNAGEYGTITIKGNGRGKFIHTGGSAEPGEANIGVFIEHLDVWE